MKELDKAGVEAVLSVFDISPVMQGIRETDNGMLLVRWDVTGNQCVLPVRK